MAAVVAIAAGLVIVWAISRPKQSPTVTIGGHVFGVELAADEATRRPGLGGRASLAADRGMLFIYPAARPPDEISFWMKNCLIDLDIAFISPDRRIVTILTMKALDRTSPEFDRPRTFYRPTEPSQFALEAAAGEFARRGIKVGDRVEFSPPVEDAVRAAE